MSDDIRSLLLETAAVLPKTQVKTIAIVRRAADEIERLAAREADLVAALRRLAFRGNNDWPRSMTCLVCGGTFTINDTGYENHRPGCCAALAKVET